MAQTSRLYRFVVDEDVTLKALRLGVRKQCLWIDYVCAPQEERSVIYAISPEAAEQSILRVAVSFDETGTELHIEVGLDGVSSPPPPHRGNLTDLPWKNMFRVASLEVNQARYTQVPTTGVI